jgi:parvulin-like peptidyl-prolyl isomerase
LLPAHFEDASASSITSQFGASFKDSLFALEPGQWTGPVESPFGLHLIRIDQIVEARVPALAEVRSVVQRDWLADRRNKARQVLFDELKAKYTITIEEYEAPDL